MRPGRSSAWRMGSIFAWEPIEARQRPGGDLRGAAVGDGAGRVSRPAPVTCPLFSRGLASGPSPSAAGWSGGSGAGLGVALLHR
jgi:hypothetical protein